MRSLLLGFAIGLAYSIVGVALLALVGACTIHIVTPTAAPAPEPVMVVPPTEVGFVIEHPGWIMLVTPSLELVNQLCHEPSPDLLGCASWQGGRHLTKPADTCFIVILDTGQEEGPEGMKEVIKHEYRHCIEGAFHD